VCRKSVQGAMAPANWASARPHVAFRDRTLGGEARIESVDPHETAGLQATPGPARSV
jgi:hypothetical protein